MDNEHNESVAMVEVKKKKNCGEKTEKPRRPTFEMDEKTTTFFPRPVSLVCLRNLSDTATHHYLVPHFFHARKTTTTTAAETNNTECRTSLQHRQKGNVPCWAHCVCKHSKCTQTPTPSPTKSFQTSQLFTDDSNCVLNTTLSELDYV